MRTDRALGLEFDDVGTRFKHGCIVSCILLGAFLGALASSACADRYGRRKATPPLNVQRPAAPPPPSPAAAPTTVIATFSVPLTPWAGLLIQLGILHRWPTRCASSSASRGSSTHARSACGGVSGKCRSPIPEVSQVSIRADTCRRVDSRLSPTDCFRAMPSQHVPSFPRRATVVCARADSVACASAHRPPAVVRAARATQRNVRHALSIPLS